MEKTRSGERKAERFWHYGSYVRAAYEVDSVGMVGLWGAGRVFVA